MSQSLPPARTPQWTILRLGQTDLVIDPSWILIFALVTWTTSRSIIPIQLHNQAIQAGLPVTEAGPAIWIAGVASSFLFFASILVHEAAHAWTAVRTGIPVRRIRLFIFGGVAEIASEPARPLQEFVITVVGPLASVLLAGIFMLMASALPPGSLLRVTTQWLGEMNLILAIFNLLPGVPLDGGRLLRSAVWGISGSLQLANKVACIVGTILGLALIGYGLLSILSIVGPLQISTVQSLWSILIGWFLWSVARRTYRNTIHRERLSGLTVRHILRSDHVAVPADGTVAEFLARGFADHSVGIRPVVDQFGRLVGIVTGADAQRVPEAQQATTALGAIVRTRKGLIVLDPDRPLAEVLEEAARSARRRFFVEADGRLIGWIDMVDVLSYLKPANPQRV